MRAKQLMNICYANAVHLCTSLYPSHLRLSPNFLNTQGSPASNFGYYITPRMTNSRINSFNDINYITNVAEDCLLHET